MLLGVIADDFTGASDIAVTLAKGLPGQGGLKTAQFLGVPDQPAPKDVEAGVVALKSRSIPAAQAIEQSLTACRWLKEQGCQQIPMTDPDIRKVLQAQSQAPTGFIAWQVVRQGSDALEAAFDASRKNGERLAVVDAIEDEDLAVIGKACRSAPLLTGGSGIDFGSKDFFAKAVKHLGGNS